MTQKVSAKYVFLDETWAVNKKITLNEEGESVSIENTYSPSYECVVPGFINTHCHLELSHLEGMIPTGVGLVQFIQQVLETRNTEDSEIRKCAIKADQQMFENGISAVGDICNTLYTSSIKKSSNIIYHNFVEAYDLWMGPKNSDFFKDHLATFKKMEGKPRDSKSITAHAPYSVGDEVYAIIKSLNAEHAYPVSIHNQETPSENTLFQSMKGEMHDFFLKMGISFPFLPNFGSSLEYLLEKIEDHRPTLFVHNTFSRIEDVRSAHDRMDQVYWTTCPRANLYIENKLPNYDMMRRESCAMTIGTDGLSSNWALCIWEEIKCIKKYQSFIALEELISWGTRNGAEALQKHELGEISVGMKPGLVHINYNPEREHSLERSKAKRII